MGNTDKTNVMRILDSKKLHYTGYAYGTGEAVNGEEVARLIGADPKRVFKTLVTQGSTRTYYVFMVPVAAELDLKLAAKAVGEKKVEMIKAKELLPLTGYVHGGCSPIGMKKPFRTVIDESARDFDNIFFSGGRIGFQVELSPTELNALIGGSFAPLTTL